MLTGFGFLAIFMAVAVVVPLGMLLLPYALTVLGIKPQHPSKVKQETYECGMRTLSGPWVQFNFRYYLFALLFVVFDVTAVFLFPWAVHIRELGWPGLSVMMVFVAILSVGLAYAWRKKALEWG